MAKINLDKLYLKKTELEYSGKADTQEYIKCIANINYFTSDRSNIDYTNIKIFFVLGLEKAYGCIDGEITNEVNTALDLMFKGDFKGYCLMSAIISSLEKCKEDKSE